MPTRNQLILVVEDYRDTLDMYGEFLSRAGFRVILASDGAEAVKKASETLPDLIVMDLSMPGMDGVKANHQLKSNAATSSIPVVLLTCYQLEHLSKEVFDAGFAGFLMKPCMPNELVAEIDRVLMNAAPEKSSSPAA